MDRLQGSHSDVYALGMLIADLCKSADNHLTNSARFIYSGTGRSRARIVSAYYSQPLKDLIRECRSKLGKDRPEAHALYSITKEKMEHYRAAAYEAENKSQELDQFPGYIFHEKVLFTKTDQDLFRQNSTFRGFYTEANLKPVWEAEKQFLGSKWTPLEADIDESIDTDHHSSTDRRRTAPEARMKIKSGKDSLSSKAFKLFVEQSLNPIMDRFSASYPSHNSTTEDDLSDGPSLLPEEPSSKPPPFAPLPSTSSRKSAHRSPRI